jgi:hypothetical protein
MSFHFFVGSLNIFRRVEKRDILGSLLDPDFLLHDLLNSIDEPTRSFLCFTLRRLFLHRRWAFSFQNVNHLMELVGTRNSSLPVFIALQKLVSLTRKLPEFRVLWLVTYSCVVIRFETVRVLARPRFVRDKIKALVAKRCGIVQALI